MWTANQDITESDDVEKSCPVSYWTISQYGGATCNLSFSRVNPDTIRCVWTGEFDLNTCGREIFESAKKKVADSRISGACGRGLSNHEDYVEDNNDEIKKIYSLPTNLAVLSSYWLCLSLSKLTRDLRAILCKNQTKLEMKNFDPLLKFTWK